MIVLLDNQDSFVYNLVDALVGQVDQKMVVYRNTVSAATVLGGSEGEASGETSGDTPDLIVLSPGPGYPADAGCMMEVIERAQGRIPILGICLGYQALIEHFGGQVQPCGPEHGTSVAMELSDAGVDSGLFQGFATGGAPGDEGRTVPVARYHSLGATAAPAGVRALAWTPTRIGDVIMAAESEDGMSLGLQFHPESILTPCGPLLLERCVNHLLAKGATHGQR